MNYMKIYIKSNKFGLFLLKINIDLFFVTFYYHIDFYVFLKGVESISASKHFSSNALHEQQAASSVQS